MKAILPVFSSIYASANNLSILRILVHYCCLSPLATHLYRFNGLYTGVAGGKVNIIRVQQTKYQHFFKAIRRRESD